MEKLMIFKSLWGMTGSLESQLKRVKEAGYDGVEGALPEQEELFRSLLGEYDLAYIPIIKTEGPDHYGTFLQKVRHVLEFNPVLINSHTGRDSMPRNETMLLFEAILKAQEQLPVTVSHETHRTRPTFSPMGTLELVETFPELRITADLSHWCCVCESLLEDQEGTVERILRQVVHIHGRVGYREGPQVPDPAAPEYAEELKAHEAWWNKAIQNRKGADERITFTPEYGPDFSRYLHTLPYTDQPVADIWKISLWTADRFRRQVAGGV